MTPEQFQAWFEGFAEALDGPPDAEQWRKVCEKVAEIGALGQPFAFTRPEDITIAKTEEFPLRFEVSSANLTLPLTCNFTRYFPDMDRVYW